MDSEGENNVGSSMGDSNFAGHPIKVSKAALPDWAHSSASVHDELLDPSQ